MNIIETVEALLHSFDVPVQRVYINHHNLDWLLKNLGSRNSENPRYNEVMKMLHKIHDQKLYLS